jgi:hypothetical protein
MLNKFILKLLLSKEERSIISTVLHHEGERYRSLRNVNKSAQTFQDDIEHKIKLCNKIRDKLL